MSRVRFCILKIWFPWVPEELLKYDVELLARVDRNVWNKTDRTLKRISIASGRWELVR